MAQKRLLYFTATRVVLYRSAQHELVAESTFPNTEEGAHAFAAHLRGVPSSLFYVLVDIVEEDFHQENVPFVRGGDRRALMARKLAQRYRDTSLSLTLSLGYEKTQRRDERVLFSSFTNNAPFQPWLNALREQEAVIAGVYSVALLAPQLAARLRAKSDSLLVVTLQPAGLRQSYIEHGRIRFSRLGPLEPEEASDANRIADAFDRETTRVYQYLTAMRVLGQGALVDALLIAPPGDKHRVESAGPNLTQINATVVDLSDAARAIGLRRYPAGAGAEVLFLHLLAKHPPREQYAAEGLRQSYRLHQSRVGLVAGGAAICALALIYAGVQLAQLYGVEEQVRADRQRAQTATEAYGRVTAGFPRLPTTPDNLRVTMEKYALLAKQTASPDRLIVDISRALDAATRIEVDRIEWEIGTNPKDRVRQGGAARAAASSTGLAAGARPVASGAVYEIAQISGRVTSVRASDYRTISLIVEEFLETLRQRPGVEVIHTQMPFEFGSQTRLSGDIGAETATRAAQFSVTVARRIGT